MNGAAEEASPPCGLQSLTLRLLAADAAFSKGAALARHKPLPPKTTEEPPAAIKRRRRRFLAFRVPAKGLEACYPLLAAWQGLQQLLQPETNEKGAKNVKAKKAER